MCSSIDPVDYGDTPEIIESRGFKCETHTITTCDGYILKQFRIVHPKLKPNTGDPNFRLKPIVLQSGLFGSSDDFIDNSADGYVDESMLNMRTSYQSIDYSKQGNNLGFLLANLGYDVWLTNFRGNYYSCKHTKFDSNSSEYWSISYDEMATIDLPTIIEHVLMTTKQETLGYIGMSRGAAIMFALLSERPECADKIKPFIALAPGVFVNTNLFPLIGNLTESLFLHSLLLNNPSGLFPRSSNMIRKMISYPVINKIWLLLKPSIARMIATHFDLDLNRLEVYFSHIPSGSPTWNLVHYSQNFMTGQFQKLDFGEKQNLIKYGTTSPPQYRLDKIKSQDIFIFNSIGDNINPPAGVEKLVDQLIVKPKEWIVIDDTNFKHCNFMHGYGIEVKVFKEIVRILANYH